MFARAARRGAVRRIRTGAVSLLTGVALLSGTALMPGLQCGNSQPPPTTAYKTVAAAAHHAPVWSVSGQDKRPGQVAGDDNRSAGGPCVNAATAAPMSAAALTRISASPGRIFVGSSRDDITAPSGGSETGRPLSRSCVLRT